MKKVVAVFQDGGSSVTIPVQASLTVGEVRETLRIALFQHLSAMWPLKELDEDDYILFDLPGQVELSTNHPSVKNIIRKLSKSGFRVCTRTDPLHFLADQEAR